MVRLLPWVGSFIGNTKTCSSVHLQQYRWNKGAFFISDFCSWRISTLLLLQQFCLQSDFCCLNKQVLLLAHWLNLSFLGSRWHHLYRKMYDFFFPQVYSAPEMPVSGQSQALRRQLNISCSTGGLHLAVKVRTWPLSDGKLLLWENFSWLWHSHSQVAFTHALP